MNGEAYERDDEAEASGELPHRSGPGAHTPPPGYRAIPTRADPAGEPAERFNYLEPVRRTPAEAYPYPAAAPDEPYEPPSLTRPVHNQPAFGRPTYDQEARRTAYEQERDSGSWSTTLPPRSRLWDTEPAALTQEPEPPPGPDPATTAPSAIERVPMRALLRQRGADRDDDDAPARRRGSGRRSMPLWQEIPLLLLVAFCMAVLIRAFLVQAFFIPSGSMEDTLLVGDRVLVNKVVYDVRTPERGEIVVFRGNDTWVPENPVEPPGNVISRIGSTLGDWVGVSRPGEKDFIKRVIGLPGDRVSCCDNEGRVYVNGTPLDEPYVHQNSPLDIPADSRVCRSRNFDEVLVPPGQLFVMGDHRIVSQDSRCEGTIPIDNVIGRAFVIVWPSSRWASLSVPDTFANVPGPVAMGPPGTRAATMPDLGVAAVTGLSLAAAGLARRRARRSHPGTARKRWPRGHKLRS